MDETGERYTVARAALLETVEQTAPTEQPVLACTDARIRERTGRGWEEWFDYLDEWHADELPRQDVARRIAHELGIQPLGWAAQAVAFSYERAKGLRAAGERPDGFAISASRTVAVPVDRLYAAFANEKRREQWLPGGELHERTATKPKSVRFDWGDGETRVNVGFVSRDDMRSVATVEHARLSDAAEAARMKAFWRAGLTALKA